MRFRILLPAQINQMGAIWLLHLAILIVLGVLVHIFWSRNDIIIPDLF
jgi:hypothetical protein